MNILHISTDDRNGGAAIAAFRLNKMMQRSGLNSKMLVLRKQSIDESVFSVLNSGKKVKIKYYFITVFNYFLNKFCWKSSYLFSFANWGIRILNRQELKEADIIYVHWTNDNFISIKELNRLLSLNIPVYFFMHDMWNITGGCHYSFDCKKYETSCSKCPFLKSKLFDPASYVFKRKEKLISKKASLSFITPSKWLADCVLNSNLYKSSKVEIIPNVLDSKIFKDIDRKAARNILNLPLNKKLILFGADGGTSNPYKGWNYLKAAFKHINMPDVELVVFGNKLSLSETNELPYYIHSLGRFYDESSLALLYNAVDVFVIPSLMDNYPNTILESLFCQTPVVAFNIGGIPDLVIHQKTGYLAEYKNDKDLSDGIKWVLEHADSDLFKTELSNFTRNNLSPDINIKKHIELINSISR